MKKNQNKHEDSKLPKAPSSKNSRTKIKKEIIPLYPLDLVLSEVWYTYSDLMEKIKVRRGVIYRYTQKGILRAHDWGGTVRFNKTYVDWMFENGGKKLSWFGWLLTLTNTFDYMVDCVPCI